MTKISVVTEVFSWGSGTNYQLGTGNAHIQKSPCKVDSLNEGQLGYTSVDTQPTPRRVTSLRAKVIAVSAANKHTAVVSDLGEVFTWGCNREGQLGYGTSNSASNYTPRVVESLKGKTLTRVSAAKYHTLVLGSDGEEIVMRNLDYVFTISSHAVSSTSPDVLANLERSLDQKSSESWSHHRLPCPTSTFPPKDDPNQGVSKVVRALRKKLQQIEMLEAKQSNGYRLDDQQIAKLKSKSAVEKSLSELGVPVQTFQDKELSSVLLERKSSKKGKLSRKHRRKSSKPSVEQTELEIVYHRSKVIPERTKDLLDVDVLQVLNSKVEDDVTFEQTTADEGAEDSAFVIQKKCSLEILKNKGQSPKVSKKSKKGGLFMFLSGALDDVPKEVVPQPPTPRNESPAWGGAKFIKGSASIREIQDEQSKIKANQPVRSKEHVEDLCNSGSLGKIKLSSFLPSSPIPVSSIRSSQASDGDISTSPWAASGTPPHLSHPSLRDIQMQQGKKQLSFSHSPKTTTAGFTIASGQGSPSEVTGVNRWFKPEMETPSSIRSIQIGGKGYEGSKAFLQQP
ncbi:Regulator of chromosome condensation, RCC1 [Sesbania bispinosa]|nr:Regulator of chromosome condensation, RCC1 [Sesbania bispinosa]